MMHASNEILSLVERSTVRGPLPDEPTALAGAGLVPHYLFYCYICGQEEGGENVAGDATGRGLPAPYSCTVWRPRGCPTLPPGLSGLRLRLRFLFRWAVHRLHLFAGPGCGALLVYDRERLVHYSGFTPGYWRFPFIAGGDLQIGDTWTDPAYRGRGLALFALQTAVAILARPGRRLWYVVEVINKSSIRVAEKAHFALAAEGTRVASRGPKLAGAYVIRRFV